MFVGRVLILLAGLAVLVRDGVAWVSSGRFAPIALGQIWFDLSPGSLSFVRTMIRSYGSPKLWDGAIASFLALWATPVLLAAGLLLVFVFRRRRPRA